MNIAVIKTNCLLLLINCPPARLCPQFTKAVEMKQVAEQDAERAKFVVMKAEQVGPVGGRSVLEGQVCVVMEAEPSCNRATATARID